jgi:hypothetical protein
MHGFILLDIAQIVIHKEVHEKWNLISFEKFTVVYTLHEYALYLTMLMQILGPSYPFD